MSSFVFAVSIRQASSTMSNVAEMNATSTAMPAMGSSPVVGSSVDRISSNPTWIACSGMNQPRRRPKRLKYGAPILCSSGDHRNLNE
jgi:hypothetical protein